MAVCLLLVGCATQKYVPSGHRKDSTYTGHQDFEQIADRTFRHDSIYVHDSIFVKEKGDTVTKYVEKIRYKYRVLRDTVWRSREVHDTTYMERRDTTRLVETVEVEKPLRWYDKTFIVLGKIFCIAALIWALFLYLRRRV